MQKFFIPMFMIVALSSFSVKAEVFNHNIYDQNEPETKNDNFDKNSTCDMSEDGYQTILKTEEDKIGEVYKCVDSKWTYQNDIINKSYRIKAEIYKYHKKIMEYNSEVYEGSINLFSNNVLNRDRLNLYTKAYNNEKIDERNINFYIKRIDNMINQYIQIREIDYNQEEILIKTKYDLLKYYQGIADYLDYPIRDISINQSISILNFNEENKIEEEISLNEKENISMKLSIEKID